MTPAYLIAFGIALFLIADAWLTLKWIGPGMDPKNNRIKVMLTTITGLILVALVIWSQSMLK